LELYFRGLFLNAFLSCFSLAGSMHFPAQTLVSHLILKLSKNFFFNNLKLLNAFWLLHMGFWLHMQHSAKKRFLLLTSHLYI